MAQHHERYPDFTIDDGETGRRLLIEHLGMLDRPDYVRRWKAEESGIGKLAFCRTERARLRLGY